MSTILIVDDSETVRQHVRAALNEAGFATLEAGDGVEGLAALEKNTNIAAIVLDVNMPRMGGLDMLERIQQAGNMKPALVLTSEADPALINRAKAAGAKGWLVKPIKPPLLAAAMKKILG